jgi:hypothetical protein
LSTTPDDNDWIRRTYTAKTVDESSAVVMHGLKSALQRFRGASAGHERREDEQRDSNDAAGTASAPPGSAGSRGESSSPNATAPGVQLLPVGGANVQLLPASSQPWDPEGGAGAAGGGLAADASTQRPPRPVNLSEVRRVLL